MTITQLETYWNNIPNGKENAASYLELCYKWSCSSRKVRSILHELSLYDNGDNLILIRSSSGKGFYKTDNADEIRAYRRECLNRGKRTFAPLRKIDRVLSVSSGQLSITNSLREMRLASGKSQKEVCKAMKQSEPGFDEIMLSKMENNRCLPTGEQLEKLAQIYACKPFELICFPMLDEIV